MSAWCLIYCTSRYFLCDYVSHDRIYSGWALICANKRKNCDQNRDTYFIEFSVLLNVLNMCIFANEYFDFQSEPAVHSLRLYKQQSCLIRFVLMPILQIICILNRCTVMKWCLQNCWSRYRGQGTTLPRRLNWNIASNEWFGRMLFSFFFSFEMRILSTGMYSI